MGQYFSIELDSKKQVNKLVLNDSKEVILIEGSFGEFEYFSIIEDKLLEVIYTKGILLLELSESMLAHFHPSLNVKENKRDKDEKQVC